jgi:hypothetical protein
LTFKVDAVFIEYPIHGIILSCGAIESISFISDRRYQYMKRTLLCIQFIFLLQTFLLAGVTNPDISAIGQVSLASTDDNASASPKKLTLGLGEAELALDAALNPYLNGAFVFSLGKDAFEIEEAYASVIRGLPLNLGLKAGKYRIGFGRLNPAHPHTYPFICAPRVMDPGIAKLLPGEESFNDIAMQASSLVPIAGNYAVAVSGDLLQGNSFHPDTSTADFGWVARIVNSFIIADNAPTEFGLSFTQGVNDPANKTKSGIAGADLKTKVVVSPIVNATLAGEIIYKFADHADSAGAITHEKRTGLYAYTDFRFQNHYNAGILYEQFQSPDGAKKNDRGIKPFIGFSLLEESTILRLAYEYFIPHEGNAINSIELQFLFSMGPHKTHLF